jgi:hypothetical protein
MERKTMKVISEKDLYVSLLTGDAVRLYAGEAREFPEYIGYACLQAGAKEVREEPKPEPKAKPKLVKKTEKKEEKKEEE